MPFKVLVVDDHEVAREGLANVLSTPQIEVAGVVASGSEAVALISTTEFDAVLLDVRMPQMDGLATLMEIRNHDATLPVVMLSTYDNPTYIARAAALGATDYVIKTTGHVSMSSVVANAANGKSARPDSELNRIQRKMREEIAPLQLSDNLSLTGREAQVLRHIALGLSNKEIARSLTISVETVKEHVQNVLRKMNANDRTDAAVRAVKLGILD